jgi:hypothetical protein
MEFTFSINYGRKYVISIALRMKGALLSTLRGNDSCHMYNSRSRKCGNGLHDVHTKNSY